jgi:hypothetical protein
VAVAAAKKKKSQAASGWSWRLAGIALCAFFVLGVLTGLSPSGRLLARRIEALLARLPRTGRSQLIPAAYQTLRLRSPDGVSRPSSASTNMHPPFGVIALVEHADGFYQLDGTGELRGPISPVDAADLPVLSGAGVENAGASPLVEYAGQLVRAEAALSAMVSEMRVESNGTATLFLDRPHVAIVLASNQVPLQLARAAQVLDLWRGHRELMETINMTTPGEAVVRPKPGAIEESNRTSTRTPRAISRPTHIRVRPRAGVWKVNATMQ